MKYRIFSSLAVMLLWVLMTGAPEAAPITFSDTVLSPGSTSYLHILDDGDFTPPLSGGEDVSIDSANLLINADITTGGLNLHLCEFSFTLGFAVVGAYGDERLLGKRAYISLIPGKIEQHRVLEFDLDRPALDALNRDRELMVDLVLNPDFGGEIHVESSVLSGTASSAVVPEPASLLLLGSGLFGLFGLTRMRG